MFEREDWTAFRTLETLPRRAGVPVEKLPQMAVKELVDNALDATGSCRIGLLDGYGFFVEDDGAGIPGTDRDVATLFSINRPLMTSKALRLPSRGALGNGLRVVTGTVIATGGRLTVATGGRALDLIPDHATGGTLAFRMEDIRGTGTRIEVRYGPGLRVTDKDLAWGREAILFSQGGPRYTGKTSPHWYDADAFYELLQSARARTVRELIAEFDGCTEPKAGKIASAFRGRLARALDRSEAASLLKTAQANARVVRPSRLGCVGPIDDLPSCYAKMLGALPIHKGQDGTKTYVPVVIEAWAQLEDKAGFRVFVNRTPVVAPITASHHKDYLFLTGCGMSHRLKVGRSPGLLIINIDTPYMPITSDGKTPDLLPFAPDVETLGARVLKRAKRESGTTEKGVTQKDVIIKNLSAAAAKAGGNGVYRFSLRQLFYAVRPFVLEALGIEPSYDYFAQVITDHEAEHGDIEGLYRDARGTLYHPHTGEEIPLGTLNVEKYRRPNWTFNKILYCEKEGFFPILREARWPERYDCALMTSKGFASRAARDVLDMLGDSGEDLYFYCIHDADAYGTTIYQSLQDATRARPCRRVHIVNLGLEPAEALEMGLQIEDANRKGDKAAPVASYVEDEWRVWLQSHRVELNAMTTPQFLEWLDRKFTDQVGKVVPPEPVLADRFEDDVRNNLEDIITEKVLREARVDDQVADAFDTLSLTIQENIMILAPSVIQALATAPTDPWTTPVAHMARKVVEGYQEVA